MLIGLKNKSLLVKSIFWLYVATVVVLILDGNDAFIYGAILRKIKYVYMLLAGLYFVSTPERRINKSVKRMLFILLAHTVIFGFFIVNPEVIDLIHIHAREMLIYLLMIFLTYFFISKEDLLYDFIKANYWILTLCLVLVGLFHLSHFVNPWYFRFVLSSSHEYRTTFGYGHANFTGNMCLFCLVYSVLVLELYRKGRSLNYLFSLKVTKVILLFDVIIGEMLFSTQSRTSILAGIIFVFLYVFFHWRDLFHLSRYVRTLFSILLIALISLFIINGGLSMLWNNANRNENIVINYPIFQMYNKWIGMGYINSSGFYLHAFPHNTFALDIYYVYILFTTGYIGSFIILVYLAYTAINIFRVRNINNRVFLISFFCCILSTGIGQTNMLTYALTPSMINWILIYLLIDFDSKEGLIHEKQN